MHGMLVRVRACRFCGREMNVSAVSHAQNPFCSACLAERLALRGACLHEPDVTGDWAILRAVEKPNIIRRRRG
jgi:hypothetical protein